MLTILSLSSACLKIYDIVFFLCLKCISNFVKTCLDYYGYTKLISGSVTALLVFLLPGSEKAFTLVQYIANEEREMVWSDTKSLELLLGTLAAQFKKEEVRFCVKYILHIKI